MRESTRRAMEKSVISVAAFCRGTARALMDVGHDDAPILGLAWSLAQNAALHLREELEKTPEGLAFIAQSQRTAAGRRPS
jgi:hypothetical protein